MPTLEMIYFVNKTWTNHWSEFLINVLRSEIWKIRICLQLSRCKYDYSAWNKIPSVRSILPEKKKQKDAEIVDFHVLNFLNRYKSNRPITHTTGKRSIWHVMILHRFNRLLKSIS